MLKKKIFAGMALVASVSLITPMTAPFAPANTVVMAMETELASSGTLPCKNGETIQYTFENGVLTISGKGDELSSKSPFQRNDSITKVVFTDDCALKNLSHWFDECRNLSTVVNIPNTVVSMENTFSRTALTEIPKLPANLKKLNYTFFGCSGITEVDFSKFPSSIRDFGGAFRNTSVTDVTIAFPEQKNTEGYILDFAYCFSYCDKLKTMVVDASNTDPNRQFWLQGLCCECSALETFELKNIPADHEYPGAYCSSSMFRNCTNLVSVKNEGYFYFSADQTFKNCSKLKNIETKGFVKLSANDNLEKTFMDCEALEGTYYIQLKQNSEIYEGFYENKNLEQVKEYLNYTFKGCSDKVTFYVNCKPLVDYCNSLKTQDEYAFDATVLYWEEKDFYQKPDVSETDDPATETPDTTQTPENTVIPDETNTPDNTLEPTTPQDSPAVSATPIVTAPAITTAPAIATTPAVTTPAGTQAPANTQTPPAGTQTPTNTQTPPASTKTPTNTSNSNTNTLDNTQSTPSNTNTPDTTSTPEPTQEPKKNISTLKLTKYKKGTKKITGKTIKSAKVTVTVNGKSYNVKSNKQGNFTVTLKTKLKAKAKIKVTVSKSGYIKKTKTFKVK